MNETKKELRRLKKDVYELGFHLTYMFLDKAIKDYEEETIPEC